MDPAVLAHANLPVRAHKGREAIRDKSAFKVSRIKLQEGRRSWDSSLTQIINLSTSNLFLNRLNHLFREHNVFTMGEL